MSGIFAVMTTEDEGPFRHDTDKIVHRSRTRGLGSAKAGARAIVMPDGKVNLDSPIHDLHSRTAASTLPSAYQLVGITGDSIPPKFVYDVASGWIATWDGEIPVNPIEMIATLGWQKALNEMPGTFALLAVNCKEHDRVYWAARGKPLYALADSLHRGIRIASQASIFYGLYHPLLSPSPMPLGPNAYGYVTSRGQQQTFPIELNSGKGIVVLSGGGLDSLVTSFAAAQMVLQERYPVELLYIDYGAKARSHEWRCTLSFASALGENVKARLVPFSFFRDATQSALYGEGVVSHEPVKGIASEWVPARNTVLMSLGIALAESSGYASVYTGINMDAASAYPDNESEWLQRFRDLAKYAVASGRSIELQAPLQGMTKSNIVTYGRQLGIDYANIPSWSCYEGGELHCGECSSCRARKEAFKQARITDPTGYLA